MKLRQALIVLILGIALGAAGALTLPRTVQPYLPDALAGRRAVIKGVVVTKERKPAALLLSVNTPQGALLATFTRNADETGLLVGPGDAVELRVKGYEPFIADPTVLRVVKNGQGIGNEPASAQTGTAGAGAAAGKAGPAAPEKKGRRP